MTSSTDNVLFKEDHQIEDGIYDLEWVDHLRLNFQKPCVKLRDEVSLDFAVRVMFM